MSLPDLARAVVRTIREPLVILDADLRVEAANALSGDEPPVVHVSGRREGDRCVFAIRDEGEGIDSRYLDRVFIIFQRLQGPTSEGTGIGLALCKRIVERHGGELWVGDE